MNLVNRLILEDYRKSREDFVQIGEIVHKILKDCTGKSGIEIMAIEHRVKAEKSLAGKLERNGDYYTSFDQLTDILGARVICFFADEVDKIGKIVEERFNIDWEHSSDKRKLIETHTFGYLSLHYIASLKPEDGYPENLTDKRFEIQIRTNLQHTWAQIEHDLGYKNEFGVPRVVERNFSRIAGMLELIDDEFVRTRDMMIDYTENVRKMIVDNTADDVRIDTVSLFEYVKSNVAMTAFLKELSELSGAEIETVNPTGYIDQLAWFGIKTLGDLRAMMDECKDKALELARKSLENASLDIISTNVGLRYLLRAKLLLGGYTEEQAADFLTISTGDRERANRQAKFLFRTGK